MFSGIPQKIVAVCAVLLAVVSLPANTVLVDDTWQTGSRFTFHQFKAEHLTDPNDDEEQPPVPVSIWEDFAANPQYGFRDAGMGRIHDATFPWIYNYSAPGWLLIDPQSTLESIIGYAFAHDTKDWETTEGFHFWTAEDIADWLYIYDLQDWALWYDLPMEALRDRHDDPDPNGPAWEIPAGDRTFYIAADGSNSAAGTLEAPWATLSHAVNNALPGDVIVVRGGIYNHSSTISIGTNRNGSAAKRIVLIAYPDETPIFDFSGQTKGSGNIGIRLNASYWHVYGLTIRNAGHNGIRMDGSNNILERLVAHGNHDTGIHMAGSASNNLVKNCDSYQNFNTTGRVGNNADGFSAKFEDLGQGNRFYGCRGWENSDDGYDFWMSPNTIVVENCWAFGNGNAAVFGNPANFEGGGNGFKLGGNHIRGDHIVIRCVSFDNRFGGAAKGFDHNNNTGALTLIHNTAFRNGRNYTFPNNPVGGGQYIFQNNLSVQGAVQVPNGSLLQGNSWQISASINAADVFISTDAELAKSPRQRDGSLPDIDFLRPRPGSIIIDAGTDIGEPFNGTAPDIGAYELE